MRLNDATVAIRPRPTWEAMDLGVLLSQRHRRLLMTSWAIVTLPIFILLTALLWDSPSLAVLIFWWLKPAFERLPLYILSTALFAEPPTLKQALRQWPRLLKPQLLASLTWRRFSLARSFMMPVMQLEGLSGDQRQERVRVLLQRDAGAARWLTVIGVHLETALWIGLMVLFYLLVPQQMELDWSWDTLTSVSGQHWRWLEHLTNGFYVLVLVVWEPIYVACGFSLYLNRRTVLEAWDLDRVFRRLAERLSRLAAPLVLAALVSLPLTQAAWAAEPVASPDAPRLLEQPVTSQASRDSIKAILEQPPFKNRETVTRYRFGEDSAGATRDDGHLPNWLQALFELLDTQRFGALATLLEVLLWGALASGIGLLIWHYRDWLQTFVSRRPVTDGATQQPSVQQAFGLDLNRDTLPANIASTAESLWQSNPREALGLLYRGLLSQLVHEYKLALKPADTENEVLLRVEQLQQPALLAFSKSLTEHWQNMAYGHRLPPEPLQYELCDGWRALFGPGVAR